MRRLMAQSLPLVLPAALLAGCAGTLQPPLDPDFVVEASIADLRSLVVEGQTSCRQVVEAHLLRIERLDQAMGIGAITEVNPRALAVADSLDAALAMGAPPGPLHCTPLLIKDNFDTHDLPTTGGSVALKGSLPPTDAFQVARLREAGAVLLAKTNMAEWAFSPRQSVSSSYGVTANAYAPDHTPAGSSGGTASGVALSFGVAGLGSDTGNSIRGPSSHLALVGIRSTLGLTSRAGIIPLAFDRDVGGPMARSVEDAARLLSVVAGVDPRDPYTAAAQGHVAPDYTVFLDANALRGARLAVLAPFVEAERSDAEVLARFGEAVADLRRLGAEVVEGWEIPGMAEGLRAGVFCRRFRYDMARYLETLGEAAPFQDVAELFPLGLYGPDARGGLESLGAGGSLEHPALGDPPCPDFAEHPARQALLAAVVEAMDQEGLDAFIFPTWSHPPAPLAEANEAYRGDNSQGLIPAAGLPALTVPMGYTRENRLPAGLQFAGRPWSEGRLLALAYAYEQATQHRRPPPTPPSSGGPPEEPEA
jgi:amidase